MPDRNVIFVSYRRSDTSQAAGRLRDKLAEAFPSCEVFLDVESIPGGENFNRKIAAKMRDAFCVLVLIGKHWDKSADNPGLSRLSEAYDIVRREVDLALQLVDNVVPVLVDNAQMPKKADVPDDIRALLDLNALPLRHETAPDDIKRIIGAIPYRATGSRAVHRLRAALFAASLVMMATALGGYFYLNSKTYDDLDKPTQAKRFQDLRDNWGTLTPLDAKGVITPEELEKLLNSNLRKPTESAKSRFPEAETYVYREPSEQQKKTPAETTKWPPQ